MSTTHQRRCFLADQSQIRLSPAWPMISNPNARAGSIPSRSGIVLGQDHGQAGHVSAILEFPPEQAATLSFIVGTRLSVMSTLHRSWLSRRPNPPHAGGKWPACAGHRDRVCGATTSVADLRTSERRARESEEVWSSHASSDSWSTSKLASAASSSPVRSVSQPWQTRRSPSLIRQEPQQLVATTPSSKLGPAVTQLIHISSTTRFPGHHGMPRPGCHKMRPRPRRKAAD